VQVCPHCRCVRRLRPDRIKLSVIRYGLFRKLDYLADLMLTSWTFIRSLIVTLPVGKNADEEHRRDASSTKGTITNRQGNFSLRCHLSPRTKHARGGLRHGGRYRDFARNWSWICRERSRSTDRSLIPLSPTPSSEPGVRAELRGPDDFMMVTHCRGGRC
jgi:hypothetical protein